MTPSKVCERVNVLGVGLSVINRPRALGIFIEAVKEERRGYITVTGVHGVMECQQDEALREIHNQAFLCTPDGMPMVWLGKLAGFRDMARVYGPDLMLDVCEASPKAGIRHFFYGGAHGVAAELKEKLSARFPGLEVVGTYEPPFRPLNPEEEAELKAIVSEARPDIIWVGLSTPKQERFMAEYLPKLNTTLMVGVGAAFDFHTGRVKQAPAWMQSVGLEWLYRLIQEPRRLWRRYLTNNPKFVFLLLCNWLGTKKTKPL
ncbi:MAG: glycosyltransferase [Verrucomicrobiales bacterium]|nr:glycosyltransferase [Verrucomicrobiales bacterium]